MSLLPRSGKSFALRAPSGRRRGPTLPGSCGCRDCRIRRCAPPKAVSRPLARPIALCAGDLAAAEHYVEMLLDRSTRHALARWRVFGRCYRGMLVIQRGDVNTGLRLLG